MKHQYKPLALLCVMFLTVGCMFCMNDILLPTVKEYFKLSYTQATLIQVSFYITYIIFPIPIAWVIYKFGYKISLVIALIICALGCFLFFPAQVFHSYISVLLAIFILSTGVTVINVAANPFITLLGAPEGAHIRINFVQSFSRIGFSITPVIAAVLIFKSSETVRFYYPYMLLGFVIVLIAILIFFSKMPAMKAEKNDNFNVLQIFRESKRYPHLLFGMLALFFYIGGESCTAGFFIPYLTNNMGFTVAEASKYLTLYYSFAAIMGLIVAIWLLKYIRANKLVGFFAGAMIIIYIICIFFKTGYNEYLLASLGLFLSVMFPTIFSLAIEGTGKFAGKGSALLNYAIVGGSIFPPIQGRIADNFGVTISYLIPCFCYCMVTLFAIFFTKGSIDKRKNLLSHKKSLIGSDGIDKIRIG